MVAEVAAGTSATMDTYVGFGAEVPFPNAQIRETAQLTANNSLSFQTFNYSFCGFMLNQIRLRISTAYKTSEVKSVTHFLF